MSIFLFSSVLCMKGGNISELMFFFHISELFSVHLTFMHAIRRQKPLAKCESGSRNNAKETNNMVLFTGILIFHNGNYCPFEQHENVATDWNNDRNKN